MIYKQTKIIKMNTLFENLNIFLAKQLDKLAIKSPLVFVFVQGLILTLAALFQAGSLYVATPESLQATLSFLGAEPFNVIITGLLVTLAASIKSRTSELKNKK